MITSYLRKERHELLLVLERIYDTIAIDDLRDSIQALSYLETKAFEDVKRIGNIKGLRVLEIGPGRGVLLDLLREAGAMVSAADLSHYYIRKIDRPDSENYVLDIQDPDGVPAEMIKTFDLVILTDVLEHLLLPADALLNCHKLLKDDGLLYVRVPAHESLINYSQKLGCPYPLVHVRTYTKSLLRREIRATGFSELTGPSYLPSSPRLPKALIGSGDYWSGIRIALKSQLHDQSNYNLSLSFLQRLRSALLSRGVNVSNRTVSKIFRGLSIPLTNGCELYCLAEKYHPNNKQKSSNRSPYPWGTPRK